MLHSPLGTQMDQTPEAVTRARGVFLGIALPEPLALAFAGQRRLVLCSAPEVTAETIAAMGPELVGCQLVGHGTDAMAVISALEAAGYRGLLAVIAPRLPDPGMVERELRSAARHVRVNLITL
jgi:hypothetical protein